MRKGLLLMIALGALLLPASGAWAMEDIVEAAVEACAPEIESYCSNVTPGEGRLLACFYAHEDKLSGRCEYGLYKAAGELENFVAALQHLISACQDDLIEHCAAVEEGEGRIATCLLDKQSEVSKACSQAIDDVGLEVEPE